MKKATIIYGHKYSGKTTKANEISESYSHPLRITASMLKNFHFAFSEADENTDLIIIDDIPNDFYVEKLFCLIGGKIEINKIGRDPFFITTPKLILICEKKPKVEGAFFERRFDFIKC